MTVRILTISELTKLGVQQEREFVPGIRVLACCDSYVLRGLKQDLMIAELAADDWFPAPDERDKRGRIARSKNFNYAGREIRTCLPARGAASIRVHFTPAEIVEMERFFEYEKQRTEAQKSLGYMAQSEDEFRERCLIVVDSDWPMVSSFMTGSNNISGGFRFDNNAIQAVRNKYNEIAEILREGRIIYSSERRQREIAKKLKPMREIDPTFSMFMSTITSGIDSTSRKDS